MIQTCQMWSKNILLHKMINLLHLLNDTNSGQLIRNLTSFKKRAQKNVLNVRV